MEKYYFAYGSNLNIEQMSRRCPDAVPIGPADLRGYELEFRRVLTIVKRPGGIVKGGLWKITDRDERALDRYEGYPGWYEKYLIRFSDDVVAMTYVLNKGFEDKPARIYLETCLKGCRDFGIDPSELFKAYCRSMKAAV